jgi:hypothetical protein
LLGKQQSRAQSAAKYGVLMISPWAVPSVGTPILTGLQTLPNTQIKLSQAVPKFCKAVALWEDHQLALKIWKRGLPGTLPI